MILRHCFFCSLLLLPVSVFAEPEKAPPAKPTADAAAPAVTGLPEAPLKIKAPADPPSQIEKIDLKTEDVETMIGYMGTALQADNKDDAYAFLFWSQRRGGRGGEMQLLATLSVMRNKTDDAFYWLQRAVLEDRYDGDEVAAEEAFKKLRADERYAKLKKFSVAAKRRKKERGIAARS